MVRTALLPRTFPSNRDVILATIITIAIVFCEVYYFRYLTHVPDFVTFSQVPTLSADHDSISFTLLTSPHSVMFNISGYGAYALSDLRGFCRGRHCTIRLAIGGRVNFTLLRDSKILYSRVYDLPPLSISCSSADWETRTCRARDICFNAGLFTVTVPYPITFDFLFVNLGSRPPPVDFIPNRLINRMRYQFQLPIGVPYVRNRSHLISIFHHMSQQWHFLYDLIVPTFLTLSEGGKIARAASFCFLR
jgi:hypothetical protein